MLLLGTRGSSATFGNTDAAHAPPYRECRGGDREPELSCRPLLDRGRHLEGAVTRARFQLDLARRTAEHFLDADSHARVQFEAVAIGEVLMFAGSVRASALGALHQQRRERDIR